MPWAGTDHGKSSFVNNFRGVSTQWRLEDFTPLDTLIDGDKVAVFGRFTPRSTTLGDLSLRRAGQDRRRQDPYLN